MSGAQKVLVGQVETEGDMLYYEVRGNGAPLLMIPGGGGDGGHYQQVAEILADEYTVITYDRRANARSTMNQPPNFEISQQSRDAVAVLQAVAVIRAAAGHLGVESEPAFIFGNSSGAVIALDMAKTQPQAVRAVIAHEAPVPRVLPYAAKWQRFFAGVYLTAFRFGSSLAALQFFLGIHVPVRQLLKATAASAALLNKDVPRIDRKIAADLLIKQELLPVTNYLPDVEAIKQNRVKMFLAVGQWGLARNTWYAQAARILAERLGGELVVFPGHHGSYMDMPAEFAQALRDVLKRAEG